MMSPKDSAFAEADRKAIKYEYNPDKARKLLSEAGWRPGSEGVLVNGGLLTAESYLIATGASPAAPPRSRSGSSRR